jgi:branched-chain amino acid transport system permease protein
LTGFDILLLLFAAVTLGGLGTALGATVGALIIGMVVEVSTLFIPNELKYAAALVILVIILIIANDYHTRSIIYGLHGLQLS